MSNIHIANTEVSILQAMGFIGMETSYYAGKIYCPFGHVRHADMGMSKAFRVYTSTNSAFCFAGCGYFSPVSLYALNEDISLEDAADALLTRTGWKPESFEDRWSLAVEKAEEINKDSLATALRNHCSRSCEDWEFAQLSGDVATVFDKCLALLDAVKTDVDAATWLKTTKEAMSLILKGV